MVFDWFVVGSFGTRRPIFFFEFTHEAAFPDHFVLLLGYGERVLSRYFSLHTVGAVFVYSFCLFLGWS